jgi:uncharacterized coiled-coil protein SlyX
MDECEMEEKLAHLEDYTSELETEVEDLNDEISRLESQIYDLQRDIDEMTDLQPLGDVQDSLLDFYKAIKRGDSGGAETIAVEFAMHRAKMDLI